ncbi:MAG: hypothetical protein KDC27_13740 [Acidobacteria bacterium]|nr:hypothetical protein [Acidobacteriota bacterium]
MKRFLMGALAGVVFGCCWAPLAMAQGVEAEPAVDGRPAALTFYMPPELLGLAGIVQPSGGPQLLLLCNLTPEPLLARAEWRTADGRELELERFLEGGACAQRELGEGERPVRIRTLWRALEPWREVR